MKYSSVQTGQCGIAILESATILSVLLSFGIGAIAVVSYLGDVVALRRIVDEEVRADSVKPLRLQNDFSGKIALEVNLAKLEQFVDRASSVIAAKISSEPGRYQGDSRIRVELKTISVHIDSRTGVVGGVQEISSSSAVRGSFQGGTSTCPSFSVLFTEAVRDAGSTAISDLAIPSGLYGADAAARFLPQTVLVGVRAMRDLRDSVGGALLDNFGGEAIASHCKVIMLRGEVRG